MSSRPIALVTGSSRGIGYGIAGGLSAAGFDVVLNGRNPRQLLASRDRLASTVTEGAVHAKQFDTTHAESVTRAVSEIESEIGAIAVLINNAGVVERAPLLETSLHQWNAQLSVNATGAFTVSTSVVTHMIDRGKGKIVNIGSVQSARSRRGLGAYAAAKGALAALTRTMCVEWGSHNIQINALAPGYVLTEMNEALLGDAASTDWLMERTPAGRWGHIDDIVGPAVWLCSAQSDFVNGQVIMVDGGITAAM